MAERAWLVLVAPLVAPAPARTARWLGWLEGQLVVQELTDVPGPDPVVRVTHSSTTSASKMPLASSILAGSTGSGRAFTRCSTPPPKMRLIMPLLPSLV